MLNVPKWDEARHCLFKVFTRYSCLMTRLILTIVAITGALAAIFTIVGLLAPRSYDETMNVTVNATPQQVWDFLLDLEHFPQNRSHIESIEMLLSSDQDHPHWRAYMPLGGSMVFLVEEAQEPKHLAVRMRESTFGMTGTWTYDLRPAGAGTDVMIAESSRIDSLFARSLLTIMGRRATIRREAELLRSELPL